MPDTPGRYVYAIEAWTDEFATWRHGFELKQKAGTDVSLDAFEGAALLTKAQSSGPDTAVILRHCDAYLKTGKPSRCSRTNCSMRWPRVRRGLT